MTITMGNILPMVTGGLFYPASTNQPIFTADGLLEVSPAVLLKEYITVITLLQTPSGSAVWPCYIGSMPDGVHIEDDCACVYDTSGMMDGRLQDNGLVIQHYGVQLKIRSKDYQDGWAKIDLIAGSLDAVSNYDISVSGDDYRIHNVSRTTPIVPLGTEEGMKRRWLFTANFLVTISQIV